MPVPISNDQNQNDGGLDILEKVELKSFKAAPESIGPFGASVVSWDVAGPTGFRVELNGQVVTKTGEEVVQPASTASYRLSANVGQLAKPLGVVQVAVDTSMCQINSLLNPRSKFQAPLQAAVLAMGGVTFRDNSLPVVTFSPGRIRIQMHLSTSIPNAPDPDVDIDMSFGLVVQNGALASFAEQVSVDITLPFWAQATVGVLSSVVLAIAQAKASIRQKMYDVIQSLVEVPNFFLHPAKGLRMHTVRVDDGSNGAGIIETTECPYDLLIKFTHLSASKPAR